MENTPGEKPISESDRYVRATIRSTGWVAGFVVFVLAGYGRWWAIAPFVAGVGLAVVLLDGWRRFVVGALSPSTARAPGRSAPQRILRLQWRFLFLALVKYPLVAVFLWALVRLWEKEPEHLMVFVGGFLLPQIVMTLRALGRQVRS